MAYIGVQPTDTYLSIASQQITGTGSATYTLDYSVSNEEDVAVFVNNVRQNVSSYTVSGTSLTLGGTISASDSCWVLFLGRTVGTKTPAVGSVTNAMLAGSIATSKLADGSTFATTNGITMADSWRITASFNPTNDALTIITSNWGQDDETGYGRIGSSMTESSGIFTFPQTGIYEVSFTAVFQGNSDYYFGTVIENTTNNSTYNRRNLSYAYQIHDGGGSSTGSVTTVRCLVDVTDTSNVKVRFGYNTNGASSLHGSTNEIASGAIFIRLGDT